MSLFTIDYQYQYFVKCKQFFVVPRHHIIYTIGLPFDFYRNIVKYITLYKNLIEENTSLKQIIKIQSVNIQKLNYLELENTRLKNLLQFTEARKDLFSLANVIGTTPDPFRHQIILNRGIDDGVYVGQPIIDANGILGSIITVEEKTSTAMLITDISYAIPVLNLRNGFKAIALGTGDSKHLSLQHVPNTVDIREKDLFVTSGLGGKYPPGYVVGYVNKVKKKANFPFAVISLTIAANLDNCQEVLLVYTDKNKIELIK